MPHSKHAIRVVSIVLFQLFSNELVHNRLYISCSSTRMFSQEHTVSWLSYRNVSECCPLTRTAKATKRDEWPNLRGCESVKLGAFLR